MWENAAGCRACSLATKVPIAQQMLTARPSLEYRSNRMFAALLRWLPNIAGRVGGAPQKNVLSHAPKPKTPPPHVFGAEKRAAAKLFYTQRPLTQSLPHESGGCRRHHSARKLDVYAVAREVLKAMPSEVGGVCVDKLQARWAASSPWHHTRITLLQSPSRAVEHDW